METKEMLKIVKDYLDTNKVTYIESSIKYKGQREGMKQIDNSEKSYHIVSFMSSISDVKYDSNALFYAYINADTFKLSFIIGPQSYERIAE